VKVKKIIPQSLKNIYHLFQAVLANVWYGFPSRKLKVIGVTGTNGKTTTVQMIAKIMEEAGYKIAIASTINFKIGEKEWVNATKFTTLSSWKIQKLLRDAARSGCEYAIVEVTSHALDQNRVRGIDFRVAVVTNVTREHLDYHKTMEEYGKAKEKLFAMAAKNKDGVAVVNLGTEKAEAFLKYGVNQIYGYAVKNPNVKIQMSNQIQNPNVKTIFAENMKLDIHNTQYTIQNTQFILNLPGEFNIENALAATCVGLSQGINLGNISEALAKIKGVPGRMERIENNRGIEIIVDYALTPDSLQKLYAYIGRLKKENSRIVAVFGSCGERDRGKRPIMGEIVARCADYCIVTNEDPYREDPQQIIGEVFEGVVKKTQNTQIQNAKQITNRKSQNLDMSDVKVEGANAFRIFDRREAIKKALQLAKPGDIVVVTGKGAEETMAVGNKRIPWNDPKVIREILRETG
jgi:UDP-N-acetylmuramoyl-L-alanyl-D-glutamate--2,6-diaminopimelate ligase